MKYLLIATLSIATLALQAQNIPTPGTQEVNSTMSAEAKMQLQQRLQDVEKEIVKLDKLAKKEAKNIDRNEEAIREAERAKTLNEQTQEERIKQLAAVKSEIQGMDLAALETKIDRLESSNKRTNSANDRAERSIARKKAQIQRLQSEIVNLENDIVRNNEKVREQELEIKRTNELITSNGLVEKQAKLEQLEKEVKELKNKHQRIDKKILKSKDAIAVATQKIHSNTSRKEMLLEEKQQLENAVGLHTDVIN